MIPKKYGGDIINIGKINNYEKFLKPVSINEQFVPNELSFVKNKVDKLLPRFIDMFPDSSSTNLVYKQIGNTEWTTSFWTGILWLMYETFKDAKYLDAINIQINSFEKRLTERIALDHHDVGFLYSLSCMPAVILRQDEKAKRICIDASELLIKRYFDKAGIIQAWGDLNDPDQRGRMIIDCAMNLPLLYRTSILTGDKKYYDIAYSHIKQSQKYLVRDNASTFHTYYMDVETGNPKFGKTAQGYTDDSCWARGQVWGVYGFMLSYAYTGDLSLMDTSMQLANYYLNRLPEDYINYWDLCFTEGVHYRDSSSSVIFCCGILEMLKHMPLTHPNKRLYENAVINIMKSLSENYTTRDNHEADGLLMHGVYSIPHSRGVDEATIWGDYYYIEALVRMSQDWKMYW